MINTRKYKKLPIKELGSLKQDFRGIRGDLIVSGEIILLGSKNLHQNISGKWCQFWERTKIQVRVKDGCAEVSHPQPWSSDSQSSCRCGPLIEFLGLCWRPSHYKITLLLLCNCNVVNVTNCYVNIFGGSGLPNGSQPTGWEPLP